ncbi:hypothetical protein C8T65DRAFT_737032 [Cerioporus squamosus]|nr:hypothetical protein C8T65DRAFT_737032 [Cerioporus squamosus]
MSEPHQLSEEYVWMLVPKKQLQDCTGSEQRVSTDGIGRKAVAKTVKVACVNCRAAAKRCDAGRPCARCVKYGLQDTCVDAPRKRRKAVGVRAKHRGSHGNQPEHATVPGPSVGPSGTAVPEEAGIRRIPRRSDGAISATTVNAPATLGAQQSQGTGGQTDPLLAGWAMYPAAHGSMTVYHPSNDIGYTQAGIGMDNAMWYYPNESDEVQRFLVI